MSSPPYDDLRDQDDHFGEGTHGRYRAVSPVAVVALVLGILSVLTVWHWALGLIPAAGILVAYLALVQIWEAPEELTGRGLAWAGLILSVAFATLGYGVLAFARAREFPYGYQRVIYADLQPDPNIPDQLIPDAAFDLQDEKVGIRGYMYPGRQPTGLKTFLLCPEIPNCPFCAPNPRRTEIIRVTLEGDLRIDYTTYPILVGGKFHVDPEAPSGLPYEMQADYLRRPR